jgi:hypothetical protein
MSMSQRARLCSVTHIKITHYRGPLTTAVGQFLHVGALHLTFVGPKRFMELETNTKMVQRLFCALKMARGKLSEMIFSRDIAPQLGRYLATACRERLNA